MNLFSHEKKKISNKKLNNFLSLFLRKSQKLNKNMKRMSQKRMNPQQKMKILIMAEAQRLLKRGNLNLNQHLKLKKEGRIIQIQRKRKISNQ